VVTSGARIAIVGGGGVFPGADDIEGLGRLIAEGRDAGRAVPPGRWRLDPARAYQPGGPAPDRVYSTWGCYLDEVAPDWDGLAVDPAELVGLDPLVTIGLNAAARAWRAARTPQVDPGRGGVIFGHIVLPTEATSGLARDVVLRRFYESQFGTVPPGFTPSGWSPRNWEIAGLPATILARALGLSGVAYTLDAACASSLYALKLACEELLAERADVMVAGGLSRPDGQYTQMGFAQLQALSKGGRCAPLSAAADGLVVGEGAGFFVLKRLNDALAAGDRILATIAGIGLSNDRGANLLAPRSEGQLRAMRAAYRQAGWRPDDVDLIECHATGTPVGDAVELESLHELWRESSGPSRRCVLGSVKSNVGHLLTAAGAASLAKILEALRTRTLPPTANYDQPAAGLAREGSPFRVLKVAEPWPEREPGRPCRAAINAFGFGGINAHVLLEEWRPEVDAPVSNRVTVPVTGMVASPQPTYEIAIVGLGARIGSDLTLRDVQHRLFQPTGATLPAVMDAVTVGVEDFRIPPVELEAMLPQQQVMLQVAAAALEDAGQPRALGDDIAVCVGINLDPQTTNFHARWSIAEDVTPAFLAEQLGGSTSTIDAATHDVAIARLRDAFGPPLSANRVMGNLGGIVASRLAREFDVGGPCFTISASDQAGAQALEAAARGLERGEWTRALVGAVDFPSDVRRRAGATDASFADAAIAIVLKRRDLAERDGNRIYGILTPTPASDSAIETLPPVPWTDAGATTSLLPVLQGALAVHQQIRPGERPQPWLRDRDAAPRAVMIDTPQARWTLREFEGPATARAIVERRQPLGAWPVALFVVAGETEGAWRTAREALRSLVERAPSETTLEALAREWFRTTSIQLPQLRTTTYVAATRADLLRQLAESPAANGSPSTIREGRLAFVFPGSGNHSLGMGREFLAAFPEWLQAQATENERLASQYRPDLIWNGPSTEALGRDHKAMIFGQVALGTAYCDWLDALNVRPNVVIGYSLGESAALFGMRAWRERDEMLRRMEASNLFGGALTAPFEAARIAWELPASAEVPWLSGVIDRSADELRPILERKPRAWLLIINSPRQCVIGGDRRQIQEVVAELQANFVPLSAPSTVHCPILKVVAKDYVALHQLPTEPPAGVEFFSGATGLTYGLSRDAAAGAILAQAIDTVDFVRVIETAYRSGVRRFLEIGPGSSCTKLIGEILGERPHWAGALAPVTADPVAHAFRTLAALIEHGVPVDLTALYGVETALPAHQPPRATGRCVVTSTALWGGADPPRVVFDPPPHAPSVAPAPPSVTSSVAPAPLASPPPRKTTTVMSTSVSAPAPAMLPTAAPPAPLRPAMVELAAEDTILRAWDRWMTERVAAHEAFLRFSNEAQQLAAQLVTATPARARSESSATPAWLTTSSPAPAPLPALPPQPEPLRPVSVPVVATPPETPPRALNYEQCLEFAIGKIGNVLGPLFAEIDQYPTRVRLPDVPLMLVDRITAIEGEPLSMTRGRVITEHDIHSEDWYLDSGRIPTCLAVESGQADLFLAGWLGIDFETRGLACYRLLDAVVTFHAPLPGPGKTIRYDIRINRFFQQGTTYLFRFEFDATVDGEPLLTMRDGCAGFFTQQELAAGQGIVHTALDKQPRRGIRPDDWDDPVPMVVERYADAPLTALRAGDLAACFGSVFAGLPLRRPETLPDGRLNLVHRVLELDPAGGKYGLGRIKAEADIHPDDWFLTCHFCDDQVMPGTLMYECCLHTLRIFLLRMGWIGERGEIAYEPVPGVQSRLKCRGQVLSTTQRVWYEVTLKEFGYGARAGNPGKAFPGLQDDTTPYALADALMYADGKPIVEITDMSVRLTGLTKTDIDRLWTSALNPQPSTLNPQPLFNTDRITAFAIGKPSDAFGERYKIFDAGRTIARLPGPPFQFLDRITAIRDCEPWVLAAGGTIVAEYDVPPDAWYFASSRSQAMPFAVLLETALQPCGWLAAYLGSALTSETDLSFRNLGGKAIQQRTVTPEMGTLTTTVKITRVSQSAGMIIQHYDYDLRCRGEPVYVGNTYFGFFSKEALANQVGIRDAKVYQPTAEETARARAFDISTAAPFPDDRWGMIRRVEALVPEGGPHGLGYLRGGIDVDPSMWFFQAHFFQDPVWPGSLGLESFLQLLQVGLSAGLVAEVESRESRVESQMPMASPWAPDSRLAALNSQLLTLNAPHEWIYRGQVLPRDKTVTVSVVVTAIDRARGTVTADGFLTVDGRVIYQMVGFTVNLSG
jgi:acyl transferase domain-containing protein/3-hydroxymyristoyl/3-hydroxydecanoyl-(acyl carrier protein) dehydratase